MTPQEEERRIPSDNQIQNTIKQIVKEVQKQGKTITKKAQKKLFSNLKNDFMQGNKKKVYKVVEGMHVDSRGTYKIERILDDGTTIIYYTRTIY